MSFKITLIAALAEQRVIGINNTLPWKLSADLKRFKELTSNHTLLMGRKTFESLGRPLPTRRHVCISRAYPSDRLSPDERWPEQVFWCGDLFAALPLIEAQGLISDDKTLFVIGGAEIYAQVLPLADELELTHINARFEGDAFFPSYEELFQLETRSEDQEGKLSFTFARYLSKRPNNILVRTARIEDAPFITACQCQMAMESENLKLNPEVVTRGVEQVFRDSSKGEYLIAERLNDSTQNEQIGCLLLQKEWSDWRNGYVEWMHSVFVKPEARRHGVFRWLYKVAITRAQTRHSLGLRLYVDKNNLNAQQTYRTLGMSNEHYELFEKMF